MQKLVPLAVLILAAFSPLVQSVGAQTFFDRQVILHWKADPTLRTFLASPPVAKPTEVSVLLVFSDIPSTQQLVELRKFGTIETFTGHVATMHLPLSQLPRVAALDFVTRISHPRTLSMNLDVSVPEIRAPEVWDTVRDSQGNPVNGTGVIIGIVDTGIDLTHRDFYFPNGTSKILYLWDQSVQGKPPDGFDYGNECGPNDIRMGTCSEIDGETNGFSPGHGTAVAAAAASTGEGAALFGRCLRYDGLTWHDDIALCQDSGASPSPFLASSTDYRYFGSNQKFNQIFIRLAEGGAYGQLNWEYSEGGGRWGQIMFNPNSFYNPTLKASFTFDNDGTASLTRNGTIFFDPPGDWTTDTISQSNEYWIRVAAENVATPALVSQVLASPPYSGVAPGALIVPVKLKDGNDDSILDGVNYVAEKARQLGRPFVINDSFGQVLGSHDGTEPLELAFADLAADGVPITVAAGNYRNANLHVSGTLSPGQTVAVSWSSGKAPQQQAIDLWYDVSDDIGITIRTPTGTNVTGPTPDTGVATTDGNVIVTRDSRATGKEWWINITSSNPLRWQFILSGITIEDGRWDAWGEPGQFLPPTGSVTGGYRIDESDTIAYPGNSRGTITVGAYVNKSLWRSGCSSCINFTSSVVSPFTGRVGIRGIWNDKNQTGMAGDITSDSGMGPTRDGRTKPEIVAPGANIAMARAANAREKNSNPDNFHQVLSGTSFSAPHVAGVIALMLQMNHYLSPDEIRTILTEGARQDKFTGIIGANGSPLWGWGKVNALNSTLGALSLYSVRVEIIPVGVPIVVNVSLDGQNIRLISLNESLPIIFEFKEGENHTVTLSQMIQDGPGTRYALVEGPWTFTAGGVRRFHYQLQFFLNVKSDFGFPTGTGWYDANSTAVASVAPPAAQGYEFQGWIGSVISNSPTLEIRMDSSKEVEAVWSRTYTLPSVGSPLSLNNIIGIILAIAISVAVAIFIRYKFPRTRNNGAARSYEVLPRPPV